MKTCTECGWRGKEKDTFTKRFTCDKVCPSCDKMGYIQDEIELHLRLEKEWERFVTINKPVRFARAIRRGDLDYETGAPTAKELARAISITFEVPIKVVGCGAEVIIDEIGG